MRPRLAALSLVLSMILIGPSLSGAARGGDLPAGWVAVDDGALVVAVEKTPEGVVLRSLRDKRPDRELAAAKPLALFDLVLREVGSKAEQHLAADAGWREVQIEQPAVGAALVIRWAGPTADALKDSGIRVRARAVPDRQEQCVRWTLEVENPGNRWSLWRVVFPQVALADLGPQSEVLFPRASGEVKPNPCGGAFEFGGLYPGGWVAMQLMAYYDAQSRAGLYFAAHDPLAATKQIHAQSRPDEHAVHLRFAHPVSDMGKPGNRFALPGEAVWKAGVDGWWAVAMVYRQWVRQHAKWYPVLSGEGRQDTPRWMRELPVWVMTGGSPEEVVPDVQESAKAVGVPVGLHWYRWHQIPFDNDYPHYFPTQNGFAEAVARLQSAGVYVMPYINGRLWDTRDRGLEDFRFTRIATAAVTKDEDGKPITETYGSKESDGSPVRLGVMCPATGLWQNKVQQTVLRLMNECGVRGVYIDQVAAAQPVLCFDPSHGHPLGGGHWWTAGYWTMLERLRAAMPADHMITTECNAEPFVKWFDGYLTWHWQYDHQVPLFPAVYGGSVQMFGRAYRGGPTEDLALRMKAGQQLVYGEQIGWFHPGVLHKAENAAFLRQVIGLRWMLRRYFFAGEMGPPPKLAGKMPTVRADWQWSGTWWVENEAVLTGAWQLPAEHRAVLLFVNTSDQPVDLSVAVDAQVYGVPGEKVRLARLTAEGRQPPAETPRQFEQKLTFPPNTAWAWELSPAGG